MAYSLNKLRDELTKKGLADDGLVAWGNSSSGLAGGVLFGAVGGAVAESLGKMHVICKKGEALLVIPFTNKEILYSKGFAIQKQNIESVALKGLLSKKLVIKTKAGKKLKYPITQGVSDLKTILQKLEF